MAVLVLQHSDRSRPGRLGATLRDHGFRLDLRRLDHAQPLPTDLDGIDGVVVLGGPQSVATGQARPKWLDEEIELCREVHKRELPLIGVCLGHQIIAAALGGEVVRMDRPEIGLHPVTLRPAGHTDTIFAGVPWTAPQYCHHSDHVAKAPPGAAVLASSQACPVQAFRAGMRTCAFQFHFEADGDMISAFLRESPDELAAAGVSLESVLQQVEARYDTFARVGERLCLNLASCLFPAPGLREVVGLTRDRD